MRDPLEGLIPLSALPAALLPFANPNDPKETARCSYQAVWRRARDAAFPTRQLGRQLFLDVAAMKVEDVARNVLRLTGRPGGRAATPKGRRGQSPALLPSNQTAVAA